MEIRELLSVEIYKACALWNSYAEIDMPHKKLNLDKFTELFVNNSDTVTKFNFVVLNDEDEIVGFSNGCLKKDVEVGYVTYVLIDKEYRRKGYGRDILAKLEEKILAESKTTLSSFDAIFFNPINLEWIVPNTIDHDHPNAPGVDMSSAGYLFMKNVFYRDIAYQNSFYKKLNNFKLSNLVEAKLLELNEKGITITFYDKNIHTGMKELFIDLDNEQWSEIVMSNLAKEEPYPVLIAVYNNKAIGFCGPLYVQDSKRGYFAGIGIHSGYRQFGLGKSLFCMLCKTLKDMGANYMTLFTGENNPARNIYEYAGFKIVKSWSDMRKIIK